MSRNDSICCQFLRTLIRTRVFAVTVGVAVLNVMAPINAQSQVSDTATLIAVAVLALPESMRAEATVVRKTSSGVVTLRPGSNGMICTNASSGDTVLAYCFKESFYALLKRADELSKQLDSPDNGKLVGGAMEKEIKQGKLTLPAQPTVGFAMRGPISAYNPVTNAASREIKRWQMIQVPYATGKALALPEQHSPDMPWVMAAGTWMAHIMIEH